MNEGNSPESPGLLVGEMRAAPIPPPRTRVVAVVGLVAMSGLLALAAPLIGSRGPEPWAPCPLPVLVPFFLIGHIGAVLLNVLLAAMWSIPVAFGNTSVNWWSLTPACLVALASWSWMSVGMSDGLNYQGIQFFVVCAAINLLCTLALIVLCWSGFRRPSFRVCTAFHMVLAWWFVTYAFPYLGELP